MEINCIGCPSASNTSPSISVLPFGGCGARLPASMIAWAASKVATSTKAWTTWMHDALVHDLAKVDAVAHHVAQGAAAERAIPGYPSIGEHTAL